MSAGRQAGFTLLGLLAVLAVSGAALAAFAELASHAARREKEAQLLFAGHQYRQAIASYYHRTPGAVKRYPRALEDLIEDKRYPMPVRHLRKLYRDPFTGATRWGIVPAPGGGIMGVHSLSQEAPVKTGNFAPADASFEGAARYADWKFLYLTGTAAAPPSAP